MQVGVAVVAVSVRFYNHWKLRKYEALQQVSTLHRQALEDQPGVKAREAEIPFGIRAIQSGIQVDGVWISGSNTPTQSAPNSRTPSVILDTNSSNQSHSPERAAATPSNPRLEVPQPAHRQSSQGQPSTVSRDPTIPNGRSLQMERPPTRLSADYVGRGRPSYQPHRASGLRYSNINENSDALDALEGRRIRTIAGADMSQGMPNFIHRIREKQPGPIRPESHELVLMPPKPGYLMKGHSSGSSNTSSSGDEQQRAPRRPHMVRGSSDVHYDHVDPSRNNQYRLDADQRGSFDALAHHRRSQGAEEGQLFPRARLGHRAGDPTPTAPAEQRYGVGASHPSEKASDPFVTPLGTPLGSPMRSGEEPPSFESFVNSNPPPENHIATYNDLERVSSSSREISPPLQHSDGNRQPRNPQIARKVNSGFEILHPGSFSQPQNSYAGDWNRDLEMGNGEDPYAAKAESGPKKLQRKRADSKESRFKEQV